MTQSYTFDEPDALKCVTKFHKLFRCPVVECPCLPGADRSALRVSLLQEEVQELADAIADNDLIEVADALADIQYVLSGAVLEFGMTNCFQALFDEVHRSNMSKACSSEEEAEATRRHYQDTKGTDSYISQINDHQWLVYRVGDHKALKSIQYSPADLTHILDSHRTTLSSSTRTGSQQPNTLTSVAEFHTLFKAPIVDAPAIPAETRCQLRVSLLQEEVQELADAIQANDLVEVADALADIQYVLSGAILEFGMAYCFKDLFDEVQRSNMSKACASFDEAEATRQHYKTHKTKPTESFVQQISETQWLVYREGDAKALKSVQYSPADLTGILMTATAGSAGNTTAGSSPSTTSSSSDDIIITPQKSRASTAGSPRNVMEMA